MNKIESKTLAVGFADILNYAKIMTEIGGVKSIEILDEAFEAAGEVIYQNTGEIRKYIGDAILYTLDDPSKSEIVARRN